MKKLKDFIVEKQNFLIKNKNVLKDYDQHDYHPKNFDELKYIIIDLLKKGITNLNCIDVSGITNMSWLFYQVSDDINVKEIDISEWDVSNVKNMRSIFWGCKNFNSDLSNWNVSNVIDMECMFAGCKNFNSDISEWDVSKVTFMNDMFYGCETFNSDLSNWNVSKSTKKNYMFSGCTNLYRDGIIPDWYKI